MNLGALVDVLVVLSILLGLVDGFRRGFFRTAGGVLGLVAGAFALAPVVPFVSAAVPSEWRVLAVIGSAVLLLVVGYSIGAALGSVFSSGAERIKLGFIDRFAGGAAGAVVAALVWVLAGSTIGAFGFPVLATSLQSSSVLTSVRTVIPDPVDQGLAKLRTALVDGGSSWLVEALDGPSVAPEIPAVAADTPELQEALSSVVQVTGTAAACGVGVTGSGYVAAPDRIITNAHVVAGVDAPTVYAPGEAPRTGRVVYVDTAADLAVIATDGLDVATLPLSLEAAAGSDGVVAGYPFGGPLTVGSARVVSAGTTTLLIDGGTIDRDVLTLAAEVNQGNSGGPLLSVDGSVLGVVFGKGTTVANVGYAVAGTTVQSVVDAAPSLTAAVNTGACTAR